MKTAASLTVLLLASSAAFAAVVPAVSRVPSSCEEAYAMCQFGFEGVFSLPTFAAGAPDTSITPVSVFKDVQESFVSPSVSGSPGPAVLEEDILGNVDETGEAYVLVDGEFIPISSWKCPAQPFSPSFYKAYNDGVSEFNLPVSGIGHETPQSNQLECLQDACVVLPFRKWQVFGVDGTTDNVLSSPEDSFVNCAAFRFRV